MKEISSARVLVVDDDAVARRLVTRLLENVGYTVVTESSAEGAKAAFESRGADRFDCIVTDYQMPGLNGVELLASIRLQDPDVSAILVTAEGEQHLVEQSLRAGFADFLNKPIGSGELCSGVAKAVAATRRMRDLANLSLNVEQAGLTQKRLLTSEIHQGLLNTDVYARPILQAGGDFFSHILISGTKEVVLVADVSGHDLSAAYISAYFQGMVRGMLESGADLDAVLQRFNRFLIEESEQHSDKGGVSISASGMCFDAVTREARVVSCGPPLAIFAAPSGTVEPACESVSFPLGWFSENPISGTTHSFSGGEFLFWTDGLGDLAAILNASPLSLVHGLLAERPAGTEPAWLGRATDDVLAARIQLCNEPVTMHTIVDESYNPEQAADINELQKYWRNSILASTFDDSIRPDCTILHDATLCAREALLNGLNWGCAGGGRVRFQIMCRHSTGLLRIQVSDPGPGHAYDPSIHDENPDELIDAHRGLMLIRALANHLTTLRNGAELIMDFYWKGTSCL